MSAVTVDFGGAPIVVQLGEYTELALQAAERAKLLVTGAQRFGTIAQREALPLDQRVRGLRFFVTTTEDGSPLWREYEWRVPGDRNGPTYEGPILTASQWCFLWTEREKLHFDIVPFQGTLPAINVEQLPTALDNIADLAAVSIADFRATALTTGSSPLIELNARLLGLKPDTIKVAYGGVVLSIPGLPWQPKDQAAVKDFFVSGNSIDDATDVPMWHTILAARRGVASHFTARYSSDKHQLARAGLDPTVLTFAGNTLPAGGTSKLVASLNGNSPIDINADYALLSTGDPNLTTGVTLHGVIVDATNSRPGTLSAPNAASPAYSFTQDDGLPAITLSGPVTFIPDLARSPAICDNFCGVGQNGFYSGVPGLFGDHTSGIAYEIIDRFAAAAEGNRFLIRDVLPDASWPPDGTPTVIDGTPYTTQLFSAMEAFNARNEVRHPGSRARSLPRQGYPNGLTLLQYLQTRGDGSDNDNADTAAGYTPRSLRFDALHPNLAGQTAMADFFEEAMEAQRLAPAPDLNTYFTLLVTGTKPALYPDEPVTSTASKVTGVISGAAAALARDVADLKAAGAIGGAPFYGTRAAGVAALPVGAFFTSNETGALRRYERTAGAPNYLDVGAAVSKADVGLSDVDNLAPSEMPVSAPQLAALAALKQEIDDMISAGTTYTDASVAITGPMENGGAPVLEAGPDRRAMILMAHKPCSIGTDPDDSAGAIDLQAENSRFLIGPACPRNALYVFGLDEGDQLIIKVG